jgi:lipopolysaccharide transport system permease protein
MFVSRRHLVEVFFTKLALNLKSETSKTYLGYVWWVLEPALMVGVLYLVFSIFLARGAPNFVVFLVCGKIPFLWFSKSVTHSSNSILAGKGLINQTAIPKPFFPMLVVFQDLVKQCFVFLFMVCFIFFYGMEVTWAWFLLIFVIVTQFLLIIAVSLCVSAVTPFLPDFRYLVSTGMMALMFGSGIFYSYKQVLLEKHQQLFLMNPLANLINNYRRVLMENTAPDWAALVTISVVSLIVIYLMIRFFNKMDAAYARLVIQ